MKKATLALLKAAVIPALAFAQNGLSWSPPVTIAAASAGTASPRLALLPDGSPAAVWGHGSTIHFSKMTGGTWGPPVTVGTGATVPGIYDFGGLDVAAGPAGIFIAFEKFDAGIFCARSTDGGATWQPPVTVFAAAPGQASTIPSIAVDELGNPMVGFLKQKANETEANLQLARSTDGGLTFPFSTDASAPAEGDFACECCYQDLLVAGGGTVFAAFRANRDNTRDSWAARSTDGGASFDQACDLDAQDWLATVCPTSGPKLARMAGDSLFSVWMSKTGDGLRVFGSTLSETSMEKGWEFRLPQLSTAAVFSQNHPDAAGQNDTLAVVWEESGFSGTGQDILCAFSTTGAAGLPASTPLNLTAATGTQKLPQLAYRDGIFHLIWADPLKGLTYRRGEVVAPSGTGGPRPNSPCPFCINELPAPSGVDLSKVARAEVFDLAGRLLLALGAASFSGQQIDVSGLPTGTYFVKLTDATGKTLAVQRFFKKG